MTENVGCRLCFQHSLPLQIGTEPPSLPLPLSTENNGTTRVAPLRMGEDNVSNHMLLHGEQWGPSNHWYSSCQVLVRPQPPALPLGMQTVIIMATTLVVSPNSSTLSTTTETAMQLLRLRHYYHYHATGVEKQGGYSSYVEIWYNLTQWDLKDNSI